MARTLYDILLVSPNARPDEIRAAYETLSRRYDPYLDEHRGNADVRTRHEAVREAFLTLGDPQARARYDSRLAASAVTYNALPFEPEAFWTMPKFILLIIALFAFGGWYVNQRHAERKLETERVIAEARAREAEARAKAEAEASEQERLAQNRERELERQRQLQESRTRSEFERSRHELDREQRRMESSERYAEERRKREEQSLAARQEMERQRADAAAVAEARRRAAREKEELCRIERERYGAALSCQRP